MERKWHDLMTWLCDVMKLDCERALRDTYFFSCHVAGGRVYLGWNSFVGSSDQGILLEHQ